jgi:gamma-glutamylaminecyclotransferase
VKSIRVFVYGTLKRGFGNSWLLKDATFLGRTTLTGNYRLVEVSGGGFPGLLRDAEFPERDVGGEVYAVSADELVALDGLEGHPNFYRRELVDTEHGLAWVYLLPADSHYSRLPEVHTMFWRQSEEEQQHALRLAS